MVKRRQSKRRAAWLATLCLLLFAAEAWAQKQLLIIRSNDSAPYRQAVESLRQYLPSEIGIHTLSLADESDPAANPILQQTFDLIITIGAKAAHHSTQAEVESRTLHIMLTRIAFDTLHPDSDFKQHSAIFIDQPLERQLQLIDALFPSLKRIGLLLSHNSEEHLPDHYLKSGRVIQRELRQNENPIMALKKLLGNSDALLTIADPTLYNSRTLHATLLSAYRLGKPVIGYSKPYVKAGALFSAFSTPKEIARQAAEIISRCLLQQQPLPEPQYPQRFAIEINTSIAKAFNIPLPSQPIQNRTFDSVEQLQ